MKTLCLLLALLTIGCATSPLMQTGRTYMVVWPAYEPEVVRIHAVRQDGWVLCQNVNEEVVYTCNTNTLLFFTEVVRAPEPITDRAIFGVAR